MKRILTVFVPLLLGLLLTEPTARGQVLLSAFPQPDFELIVVSGSLLAASPLDMTTLTPTFPGPIPTNPASIQIEEGTGVFASGVSVNSNPQGGVIQVTLPGLAPNALSGSFRLTGIPFPTCGQIALALSSTLNNYLLGTPTLGEGPPVVITSANVTANGIVEIQGTDFCSPRVFLAQTELTGVVPLPTGDGVSATLPANIAPGSYLLTVLRGPFPADNDTFSLTIGAVGPRGPKGDKGDDGPQGIQGIEGLPGLSGHELIAVQQTLPRSSTFSISGTCPSGKKILSGGLALSSSLTPADFRRNSSKNSSKKSSKKSSKSIQIVESYPSGPETWTITGINQSSSEIQVTVRGVCAFTT